MSFQPKASVVVPVAADTPPALVDVARQYAKDATALHILHVVPSVVTYDPAGLWASAPNPQRFDVIHNALTERFGVHQLGARVVVRLGDAAVEVARYAQDVAAELIVLASHQRRGVSRWFLGSVAEETLRRAPCPVLLLRLTDLERPVDNRTPPDLRAGPAA